jgi:pSer/pThr/pTyr-binding forkhead associated (FHA) protein
MRVTVVHMEGSKQGQTETFAQAAIAIGRDPATSQLLFDAFKDADVSARHAQLLVQGEQLLVQDLNSRNGTFVNGVRVGAAPVPVPEGATVQFGANGPRVTVSFRVEAAGPGKKTQLLQDLRGRLEEEQSKRSRTRVRAGLLLVVSLALVAGGFQGWTWLQ